MSNLSREGEEVFPERGGYEFCLWCGMLRAAEQLRCVVSLPALGLVQKCHCFAGGAVSQECLAASADL